ncbi:MAG: restriction endonuclease [Clostridia bacterium]|nr:restriction endonuclease [Clostridia bacterium]
MFDLDKLLNCTPREFEEICCAYAQAKYGDRADVKLTPPTNDGGKDIEIIIIPTSIIHWGECKMHDRNIDLSSIGKNVVLVQSRKIRKIIFFSTKDIVYNTKKHIINVAHSHKFEVVFLDGGELFSELASVNILQDYSVTAKPVKIDIFAEEFTYNENAANYVRLSENTDFTLKSSNKFSFLLLLKNRSFNPFTAKVTIEDDYKHFKIKIPKNKIKLPPFSDITTKIDVESNVKYGERVKLSPITINVDGNTETFYFGEIKTDFYPEISLVGQSNIDSINAIQNGFTCGKFNIAKINGKKGIGKSRLVKELIQRFKVAKIFRFYSQNDNVSSMLSIFSFILGIQLNTAEKMNTEVFNAVLRSKNFEANISYLVGKYYSDPYSLKPVEINALFSFVITKLMNKSNKRPTLIAFDGITELDTDSVRFLLDLIKSVSGKKSGLKVIVVLEDDKKDKNENLEILKTELAKLTKEKKCFTYKCKELEDKDKLVFCLEILGKNEEPCAKLITDKFPGVPATLSNVCNSLLPFDREERISKLNKLSDGADFKKACDNLIANLVIEKDGNYGEYVKTFCKWLILFQNKVPAKFVKENSTGNYLQNIKCDRLIKYSLETDTFMFNQEYHLNIFKDYFCNLKQEAETILHWLDKNKIRNSLMVTFACLTALNQPVKALECGFQILENSKTDVRIKKQIAETLYLTQINSQDNRLRYNLVKTLAHIYLFNNNFKEGVKFFKKAYVLSLNKSIGLKKTEIYHIRHEYINSLIHCGRYIEALNTLNGIREIDIDLLKYRFLLHNRLGVANTFLYDTEIAQKELQIAMELATAMNDKFFISTVYSDIAYLYLKSNKKDKATIYFNKACSEHRSCGYSELYRDIEINEQKAIALALAKKYDKALEYINRALTLCEKNYSNFSLIKVNLVKAYICICTGNFEIAEKIYNESITLAKIFNSDIQLIYTNAGLATLYMLQNKDIQVRKIFDKLIHFFKKFEGVGAKCAILKNFALWFYLNNDTERLNLLCALNLTQLNYYIQQINECKTLSEPFISALAQNAANFNGLSFLY